MIATKDFCYQFLEFPLASWHCFFWNGSAEGGLLYGFAIFKHVSFFWNGVKNQHHLNLEASNMLIPLME